MLVNVEGATAAGQRFQFERELERVPMIGEVVEYEGSRYIVEARTEENTGGEITRGSCRLKPVASPPEDTRCDVTGFYVGNVSRCIHQKGHFDAHQFR